MHSSTSDFRQPRPHCLRTLGRRVSATPAEAMFLEHGSLHVRLCKISKKSRFAHFQNWFSLALHREWDHRPSEAHCHMRLSTSDVQQPITHCQQLARDIPVTHSKVEQSTVEHTLSAGPNPDIPVTLPARHGFINLRPTQLSQN